MNPKDEFRGRRRFIKTVTFVSAYSSLFGKAWTDILAAEIKPSATSSLGTLRLKLQAFPALLSQSGSVRVGINPLRGSPPSGPTPNGQFYPVIINRGPNDTFFALTSRCTHEGCVVDPMDPFTNRITCPCHGSVFAIDGRRLVGPAPTALTKYTIKYNGVDAVEVQIPGLAYSMTFSNVQAAGNGNPRLRIGFRSIRNVDYEIHFRESLDQAPMPVAFSTTPDGMVENTVFSATSIADVGLFVERTSPTGFYSVAALATEL